MEKRNKLKVFYIYFTYSLLFCKTLDAQTALDPAKLEFVKRTLYVPPLDELKTVFLEELSKNFAKVSVEIVESPDLSKSPFNLAAPGLGGMPTILDVGGISRYSPQFQKQPLYDIKTIIDHLGYEKESFIIGAANGPWPYLQKDCDVAVNVVLNKTKSVARSYGVTLDKTQGRIVCQTLPLNETRFAVQGSLFLSEGKPGKVLKVHVKKRIGEDSFIASMRRGIENRYGRKLVGIGGAFVVQKGKTTEIFANALEEPVPLGSKLRRMKYFYVDEDPAPGTGVGTFVSAKTELDLASNHFHMFSQHGDCGHYYQDVSPTIIEYLGYFTPGEILYKVDQAPPSKIVLISDHF